MIRSRRLAPIVLAACVVGPRPVLGQSVADFREVASLDVGRNPHQIAFSEDGRTAWIATAGEDRVTVVDAITLQVVGFIPVPGTPLGVAPTPNGTDLAVARFQGGGVGRYARSGSALGGDRETSAGASLLSGPYPHYRYLVSVEQADSVHVFDADGFTFSASYAVGDRPFPGAATSDFRKAFVPGYADGTVTVIDLFNDRVLETVVVGTNPSGGVVLPGDEDYAVVVRGDDRVRFINTASHRIVGELSDGIGDSPFSFVVSPNGRLGFVNNTASNDVSVVLLPERRVLGRIPVPDVPIVMAVHPSGETLWVSSEGVHRLTVIEIPDAYRDNPGDRPRQSGGGTTTEVAVMGMIHGTHRTSALWGIDQVMQTIANFRPDIICAEIAPDRWARIERDLAERDAIEDPRVLRFPEYADDGAILRSKTQLGYRVEPCAGWTLEMSDARNATIASFDEAPRFEELRGRYRDAVVSVRAGLREPSLPADDPRYIHSSEYDERQKALLALYDQYQNDLIGPGGWANINVAHYRLIDAVIRENLGARILVTFGGGHKYWLLEQLSTREDIELFDLVPFLPSDGR